MKYHKVKQDNKQHGNKQPRQAFRQASKPQQTNTRQARTTARKPQKSLQDGQHKPNGQRPRISHTSKPEERTQAKRQAISLGQSKPPSMATATKPQAKRQARRARNGKNGKQQAKRHGNQANTLNTQTRLKPCTANGISARLRNFATQRYFCKAPDFIKTHQHPERVRQTEERNRKIRNGKA